MNKIELISNIHKFIDDDDMEMVDAYISMFKTNPDDFPIQVKSSNVITNLAIYAFKKRRYDICIKFQNVSNKNLEQFVSIAKKNSIDIDMRFIDTFTAKYERLDSMAKILIMLQRDSKPTILSPQVTDKFDFVGTLKSMNLMEHDNLVVPLFMSIK